MTRWRSGVVLENRQWTDTLFSIRVRVATPSFEAGQFVRISTDARDPESLARAFSFVNAPGEDFAEFFGVVVPSGALSPRLATLRPGDGLSVADNPAGFLVLSEVPSSDMLWMFATGTGLAPFLSILRSGGLWQRHGRAVLVQGVRCAADLAYSGEIGMHVTASSGRLTYVRVVSREDAPDALRGRIPACLSDGSIEATAGLSLTRDNSQVMICGNPDMLKDLTGALFARGLRKHRRRTPGQITTEAFW